MCHRFLLLLLSLLALGPQAPAQDAPALRVHIRGGVKTHGPGQHDHPRFLDEWTQLLAERGASATGSMEFPSAAELDDTDVLVFYAAEGGSIHGAERARLEGFIGRGGGLVVIHDAVCGDDSHWFKTIVGGAWEHGHSKWHEGEIGLYFKDREHPITRGASNFDFKDEIYWDLHLTEEAHVLAESFHSVFDVHPQMWVVEREHSAGVPYRAFVSIQGHEYTSFSHLAWRAMLLRGIAWAGKRDAELLTTQDERAALRYPAGGPTMPSAADATFSGNEDFEVSLVASEPAVLNPISIDWDARDRMWVACTPGYPLKAQNSGLPASDHILILEDRDGDGQAEHETEFYASLDLVTSLVHHKDGVIVSQAPDILWLRDLDGDDVCDVVVTLYSGFGFGDTHAVLSNLRWGMDGWIYATQGYSGGASRNVIGYGPTGTNDFGPIGNGLLRFRPDGSNIEMVSSYGSNTWGLDFSWDGELFFTMANGAHLRHIVLPEPVLARGRAGSARSWADVPDHHQAHPTSRHDRPPYVQIDFVGGFTAASGSLIYNGGAWPAEFAGNHFVAEPTLNLVHRDVIHSNGPSFTAVKPREGEFLAAEDLWFRPVHMRTGPDGAMYVLDFYNQAAIHNDTRGPEHGPTNAAIRPDRDRLHGRIWRVQHKAATALATLDFGSVDGCITSLSHPNRWARMTGQRLLAENEETALWWDQVTAMIGDSTLPAYARIHALHLHMQIAPDDVPAVIAALADMDESVRKNAAWIVADLKLNDHEAHDQHAHDHTDIDRETLTELTSGLLRQIEQPDDRLRLAALTALSTLPSSDQLRAALIPHLTMPQDDWTKSALLGNAYVDPKSFMVHTLLEGEGPVAGELVQTLVRRLASRFGTREVLIMCGALAPMRRANDEMVLALVRGLVSAIPESEVATWDEEIEEALMLLLMDDEMEIAKAAVPLVSHWDQEGKLESSLKRMAGSVMKDLIDEDSTWDTCLQSLDILLQLPTYRHSAIQVSLWMLEPGQPLDMQERAIVLFGTCNDLAAGQALITNLRNMTAAARNLAFPQILRRPDWCQALIDQVEAGDLSRTDLGPQRVFQLVEHPDAAVSERARATLTASNTDKDALIASLLPHVIQPGDVARGRTLFEEQCATCHSFRGAGADVGPPLDGMGA
ncbi:MAG: putative membrane-bound dehydrogenase-like protein, partial [Planctomycetota bacterium]